MLLATYPIVAGTFDRPALIAVGAMLTGLFRDALNVALFSTLTELAPPHQRPQYIGMYSGLVNIAVFAGPLAGAGLTEVVTVEGRLVGAGVLRAAAGLLFLVLPFALWEHRGEPALR